MELTKTKYKQTEIGLIPEDWELVPFDSIFSFYSTSNYSKAQMSEADEVGCIHYGLIHAIKNTNFDLKSGVKYYVTSEQAKYEFVRDGDVIMVDASEDLEGINKSVEIFGVGNKKYISGLHTYLLRDKKYLLADNFRGVILNSQSVKNQMLQLAVGMKVFGVSKTQLINVKIPLPPLPEQKAIAQVLSDTDTLIQTLEQKLAKKRAIKQGAMQQLLTPKEDWEVRKLGEISHIKTGKKNNQDKISDGQYPFFVRSQNVERINSYSYDCEAILIPGEGGIGSIYHYINGKFDVHQRVYKISEFVQDVLGKFIYLYMKKNFNSHAMKNSVKATVDSLRLPTFLEFEVSVPPIQEQIRIATILSDMDLEIGQLEQKLEKYKLLKQGLMQELLTGRIRLV
ncbi:type I restriction enzyme S subunit [Gelidibacter algens]|uniref:Type I restriction enzyme S subunit n=1 Tax=Gelidibacter algens TaxID=49280 RepID=A0A1A7QGZ7_9FLAO|nr:restriction endonuclease subunit S [Gelidibacter algens]OBX19295.1 hypothetical protein A9996_18895 [Gelidibacter algens]RAJ19794.1 type I restriction enzyme S subunit [Gelidibacter algens]